MALYYLLSEICTLGVGCGEFAPRGWVALKTLEFIIINVGFLIPS